MMTRRRMSLSHFVATTLVSLTTALLVTLGIIGYRSEAKKQRENLKKLTIRQAEELPVALALPVWNIDRPQIAKIIEAMSQPPSVYAIRVDAAGETYGLVRKADWILVPWNSRPIPAGMIVEERPIIFNGRSIGTSKIYVTPQRTENDLRDLRIRLGTAIVLIDLLIIVSVYLVLWRSVLRPVTEIERYAGAVSAGDEQRIAPSGGGSSAELESLRSSIESMVGLLELREQRFRSIFDSVNDAILILDRSTGAILDVNARMCEMFGYPRDEATSLDLGALISGAPPYTLDDALARIRSIRPGDRRLFEVHARHRDGHLFWVEVSQRTATIGGAARIVSVVRDIDQRKAMEEALRRSETTSLLGGIVAGVAHEVRNPLFGIAAAVDAFEAEFGGGGEVAEYLTTLRNDVSRLTRLMHDLLDYGRPQQIERHVQSIRPVLSEAIRVCTPRAREKRIDIREEIADDLPDVAIDADRMLQVFRNVVENAVEFSEAGKDVILHVSNGAGSLVFTVTDHGPGFRLEDLPHVFEPFFTRRPGGSGLGLAIVQKIVSDHGGTIAARNAAEGGGVVEVRLPLT